MQRFTWPAATRRFYPGSRSGPLRRRHATRSGGSTRRGRPTTISDGGPEYHASENPRSSPPGTTGIRSFPSSLDLGRSALGFPAEDSALEVEHFLKTEIHKPVHGSGAAASGSTNQE